jgi:hypothetical protein
MAWDVYLTSEVDEWLHDLARGDFESYVQCVVAIEALVAGGPAIGRPLVDRIKGSSLHNLKELRPGSTGRSEVRILFVFDPWRSAILLVAGDKSGVWASWYEISIPIAERRFAQYLEEREMEEEGNGN